MAFHGLTNALGESHYPTPILSFARILRTAQYTQSITIDPGVVGKAVLIPNKDRAYHSLTEVELRLGCAWKFRLHVKALFVI